MHLLDITPPFELFIILLERVPKADLAQVFQDDVLTFDVGIGRLNSAVLATAEAVILQVLFVAVCAFPEHIARFEDHFVTKLLLNLAEVLEEIDGAIRRRCEPEVDVDVLVLGHHKLAHEDHGLALLVTSLLVPFNELLSVVLSDQHRWDTNTTTSSIVAHENLINHLWAIIHDDSYRDAKVLHVANFLDEGAISTVSDHERSDVSGAVQLELIFINFITSLLMLIEVVKFPH